MSSEQTFADDPVYTAAVDLLRRTGIREFQIRYSDDIEPVVWMAVARWQMLNGVPVEADGRTQWDAGAALTQHALDGGRCAHCGRPTGVTDEITPMPAEHLVCWYQFDPELQVFRRGCEGSTP